MRFKVVRICGSEANTVLPEERIVFDLRRSASILRDLGYSVSDREVMLVAVKDGVEISVYRTGRMVIHPAEKEKAREMAEGLYNELACLSERGCFQ
ncbi:MAG TPA: hypothetical protein VGK23_02850 [Methanomassiliicoccales archaeon]|jgi:hypothetical protein